MAAADYPRGTVVFVPFPFTDLSGRKRRPALVVSPGGFDGEDLILCAITSRVPAKPSAWGVILEAQDMADEALPKRNVVKVGKLFTMHKGLIAARYGAVKAARGGGRNYWPVGCSTWATLASRRPVARSARSDRITPRPVGGPDRIIVVLVPGTHARSSSGPMARPTPAVRLATDGAAKGEAMRRRQDMGGRRRRPAAGRKGGAWAE